MNTLYWLGAALLGGWLASGYGEKTESTPYRPAPIPPRRTGGNGGNPGSQEVPEEPVREQQETESALSAQEDQFGRRSSRGPAHDVRAGHPARLTKTSAKMPAKKPAKKPAAIPQNDALGLDLKPIPRQAVLSNREAEKRAAQEAIRPFSVPGSKKPVTSPASSPPLPLDFDEELDLLEEGIDEESFGKKAQPPRSHDSDFGEEEEDDWLDWAEAELAEEASTQLQVFGRKPKGRPVESGDEFEDLEPVADPYARFGNVYNTPAGPVRHRQIDTPDGPRNLYTFPDAQGAYPTVYDTPDGPRYVYPGALPGETVEAVTERQGGSYFYMSPQRLIDLDSLGLSVE